MDPLAILDVRAALNNHHIPQPSLRLFLTTLFILILADLENLNRHTNVV